MEAQRVLDLVSHLDALSIQVWLDGGWGIDALLETETRQHDDLDLIARIEDVSQLQDALRKLGYSRVHGEPPLSFEMTDALGHQVDVHPVHFDATGDAIYRMSNGDDWAYPLGSLSASGTILGRSVRCQTPEMQMLAHTTGYALDAHHRADVAALAARFDLLLPPFRSA